jgi:ferric-dicitrate binding protein FerR (iron transport regulator)
MTPCERNWEVEAARDGRLDSGALAAFAQHRATCASCQREQRALDALAERLKTVAAHTDDMALRRMRQRTLDRANELVHAAGPRRKYALAAVLAAVAVLVSLSHHPSAPADAIVQVEARQNAEWHRAHEQDIERVELTHGTLLFRVARKPSDPRLMVRVPDGEIEDLGTVFSVSVEDGKTREIVVLEGRVLFHRHGASPLHLRAGTSWHDAPAPLPAPDPEPQPAPSPPSAEPPVTKMKKPKRTPVEAAVEPPRVEIEAGNGEDAAYLHIVALLREGRRDEARLAAIAYLRSFPGAFRSVEVSKIAATSDAKSN